MSGTSPKRKSAAASSDAFEKKALSSLESTFGNFSDRLKRQKKERDEVLNHEMVERRDRQARLLKAMTTIRRALQETGKIDLGERFRFAVELQDWQGWPRVELRLVDSFAPDYRSHCFVVTASDLTSNSSIRISDQSDKTMAKIDLGTDLSLRQLPVMLKKNVRKYLDSVASYVLNPKRPEELLEVQTKRINMEDESASGNGSDMASIDVFQDDSLTRNDNRVDWANDEEGALESLGEVFSE